MNADAILKRIEGFNQARGGVIVRKVTRGYTVHALWSNASDGGASGPFGIASMVSDLALNPIAKQPDFWIHA